MTLLYTKLAFHSGYFRMVKPPPVESLEGFDSSRRRSRSRRAGLGTLMSLERMGTFDVALP